jgi:uncharacterized protein (TIGR02646 family)
MRPIERGPTPQVNGTDKTVADYKDWRQDLLDRIGNYCSYCNMVLNDSPQVEHVSPKSTNPALRLSWHNMVLACGPCNRAKSDSANDPSTHYMPDHHNTHLAFDYLVINHPTKRNQKACVVAQKAEARVDQQKARNTIALCKLDALTYNRRATDLRWKYRFEAVLAAAQWKEGWDSFGHANEQKFISLLMTAATGKGFFSVWFNVFENVPAVKQALITNFLGTDLRSFDSLDNFRPVPRNAGDL